MSDRYWTRMETSLLLGLMAKSVHLPGRGRFGAPDTPALRQRARMDFVDAFNVGLNGKSIRKRDLSRDIPVHEILYKLDEVVVKQKHVVGPGGLMERSTHGRLTRSLTLAFRRTRDCDFTGTKAEWEAGRKMKVINKYRMEQGIDPLPASAFERPTPAARNNPALVTSATHRNADKVLDPGTADMAFNPSSFTPRGRAN